MRPLLLALLLALACALPSLLPEGEARAAVAAVDAKEILDHTDDLFRGLSSHGKMTMRVVTAQYTREMTLETWAKGRDLSMVRILEPQKEKGTGTLRSGENIWNYLPKVQRVVKVPGSMMGGAWMGSHFTHDDLVKQSRMAESFTYAKTFDGTRGGQQVVELTLTAKPDAAVVWGKVVLTVRAGDLTPLQMLYYDEDLQLSRTMSFSDVRRFGDRTLPAVVRITPTDKPKESTEIVYHQLEFGVSLPDSFFSLQSLQNLGAP